MLLAVSSFVTVAEIIARYHVHTNKMNGHLLQVLVMLLNVIYQHLQIIFIYVWAMHAEQHNYNCLLKMSTEIFFYCYRFFVCLKLELYWIIHRTVSALAKVNEQLLTSDFE